MVWTRPSVKELGEQTDLPRGLLAEKSRLSLGGAPPGAVCMVLFRWVVALFFFFFFCSPGLGCYYSSLGSRSTGSWLAGPAVTSEKGSQSEQDSACLPAANSWSCNKQELQVQPGTALSRAKPGGIRGLKAESQIRDFLRPLPWSPGGALTKPPLHPASFFPLSIWLLRPTWMSVGCGKGRNQRKGGRNVGDYKIRPL